MTQPQDHRVKTYYLSVTVSSLKMIKQIYGSPLYAAYCKTGDIRLLDGEEVWEGRLEVCHNGRWGTVGVRENEQWSHFNNDTICGYFGYETTSKF